MTTVLITRSFHFTTYYRLPKPTIPVTLPLPAYIEDGLYSCHSKKSVRRASDLHEAAEERIKIVFRKKREAGEEKKREAGVEPEDDGVKVLSSRLVPFSDPLIQ